jgi:hypothetical protein
MTNVAAYLYERARPHIRSAFTNKVYYYVAFILSIKLAGCRDNQTQTYKDIAREHRLPIKTLLEAERTLLQTIDWHIPREVLAQ